jgi:transcriptional regulator with XRE-family HTH domain
MDDLRQTIGANLTELRKQNKLTQLELAQKLSYSDKAVSKWEHGDALPSIEDLVTICEFYGVTLDQLTHKGIEKQKDIAQGNAQRANKIVITCLSVLVVWLAATSAFVGWAILKEDYYWQFFLWAIPLSCIILLVFNGIWGKSKWTYLIVSVIVWSLITCFFCTLGDYRLWMFYLVGVPAQIIIVFWSRIKTKHTRY